MRSALVVLLAAALAAAPAAAQFAGEHLAAPADPAMVLGWKTPSAPMQEYVARGESVNDWTRMVTLVQLPWRPGVTPVAMLERFSRDWPRSCPGATSSTAVATTLGAHPAAEVRLDCSRNPRTGKPETMIGRAVLGDEGLYMVQAAMRRRPSAADLRWAAGVTGGVTLCPAAAADARCRATRDPAIGQPL